MQTDVLVGDDFNGLYKRVLEKLLYDSEYAAKTRGEMMHEITNFSFVLTNPYARFVWNTPRTPNYLFAIKNFLWILNGCDDAEYLMDVNPNAKNYLDKDGEKSKVTFETAYGPRIHRQLPLVLDELRRDEGTRRATINVLLEEDKRLLGTDSKTEFPCLETITFNIRHDRLNCYANFRSNNMVTTAIYDVFVLTMLQEYLLNVLKYSYPNLVMGQYYHHATSAHYFDSQLQLVDRILEQGESDVGMVRL